MTEQAGYLKSLKSESVVQRVATKQTSLRETYLECILIMQKKMVGK